MLWSRSPGALALEKISAGPGHAATDHLSGMQFYRGEMHPRFMHRLQAHEQSGYQDKLTEHIRQHGISTPITLIQDEGFKGRPYIGQGHHRHQSATTLGLSSVPVALATNKSTPPRMMRNAEPISHSEYERLFTHGMPGHRDDG